MRTQSSTVAWSEPLIDALRVDPELPPEAPGQTRRSPSRGAVDLERPQAQPAALERAAGEVEVEARELSPERIRAGAPARAVQAAEGLEVRLEPLGVLREPEADLVLAGQLAFAAPDLLAE